MTVDKSDHTTDSAQAVLTSARRPLWMRVVGRISDVCGAVSAGMILISVLLTCQMIWIRKVNNESTVWQTETVIYLMIGATLIGLPYVQRVRGHVSVDLLPLMLPQLAARILSVITLCAAMAVIGIMLFYGTELWWVTWEKGWRSESVWGPKLWIPYLVMPVGFGLYFLQLAADAVAVATGIETLHTEERTH